MLVGRELSRVLALLLGAIYATCVSILMEIAQEAEHRLAEGWKPSESQETYYDAR